MKYLGGLGYWVALTAGNVFEETHLAPVRLLSGGQSFGCALVGCDEVEKSQMNVCSEIFSPARFEVPC